MILPKISLPRCQAFIKFPLNNTFNFRPDRVQQRQLQIANPNEEFMSGTKKAVHSYTPWYVERKVNLFGRNSASGTGESFYRMQPNLEYDPSLKAGLFLQMFRGFCSSSLRAHRFNVYIP
uniref:Uncharacterized protein n=1 Tax=Setaria digitata TaxID=48799 RepID=A0A915PLS4_9BILA